MSNLYKLRDMTEFRFEDLRELPPVETEILLILDNINIIRVTGFISNINILKETDESKLHLAVIDGAKYHLQPATYFYIPVFSNGISLLSRLFLVESVKLFEKKVGQTMIEKRGLDEIEEKAVNAKIKYLEARVRDDNDLVKEAGGEVEVILDDWDNEHIYFSVKIGGAVHHKIHYSREDLKNGTTV